MSEPGGHTARVRRVLVLGVLLALAAAGGGWLAFGSAQGSDDTTARAAARPAENKASLPPLPQMRPKVVQPAAGEVAAEAPADDEEVEVDAPKPTRAASATKKLDRDAAQVAGDGTHRATALSNGIALPPLEAPEAVHQMIEAGNVIARSPYVWGGGHGKWLDKGYDCSGSVSFVLASAGLLSAPLDSGRLMSWGEAGRGKWVTIYSNRGHVWMVVAGIRFDTSGAKVTGSRWQNDMRPTSGFVARHPAGI
jgi:cell wall-associated NlpC family hydrolase